MSQNPIPATTQGYDLESVERRQAALFQSLTKLHKSWPEYLLTDHGLVMFHRFEVLPNGKHYLEAILAHADGGQISSGLVPIESVDANTIHEVRELSALLLLGSCVPTAQSQPQQAQTPLPLQQEPAVASAGPERRAGKSTDQDTPLSDLAGDPEPQPVIEAAAADAPPDADDVRALLDDLDVLHNKNPEAVKAIVAEFRKNFDIGRAAFARSITTRERAVWLRLAIHEANE